MVINRLPSLTVAALALALFLTGHLSPATAQENADGFIRDVGKEAIALLTQKGLSNDQREENFRAIFNRAFQVRLLARFTLGRYWRRATKAQQQEYVKLFEDFVVQAYAARFADYSGEKFNVGNTRDIKGGDKLVASEVILTDGRAIPVHWRVRTKDGLKIVDVLVEGVSMAITQRDEFASIINQSGGKIDGLLIALKKRTGK